MFWVVLSVLLMWLQVCSGQLLGHFGLLKIAKFICDPEIWLWTFWSTSMRFVYFYIFFWGIIHVFIAEVFMYMSNFSSDTCLSNITMCVYIYIYIYMYVACFEYIQYIPQSSRSAYWLGCMDLAGWLHRPAVHTCTDTHLHTQTHIHTATCAPSPTGMTSAARLAGRKDLPKSHTDTCIHISEGRADV